MTNIEGKPAARKKVNCTNCQTPMTVDFNTAEFSRLMKVVGRQKVEERSFYEKCPQCGARNIVTSQNPVEWGDRKVPSFGAILVTGFLSVVMIVGGLGVLGFFAWQGIKTLFGWI
ncbi:hypothetical protein [Caryophanon tenue]|uniref:Redox protein n=1 Tax=Caryophanon tenue TaxID=33978 RepID=A0A1C0YIT9_9BACL|nr:hypothetical protein [Caryophanon tenue]OCS87009.1 hypothetical protein A6M13_11645 [Caryophanon tenue]